MMKNMSLSTDYGQNITEGAVGLANHSSVQELANTLLADPMSLFRRRRTQWRSASARGRVALTSSIAATANASSTAASRIVTSGNATAGPEDGGRADGGGIQKLTLSQREALVRKWGAAFEQLEEEAFALFCRLHSASAAPIGRLTKHEFAGALRLMGADRSKASFDRLLHFMFEAIDLERTGSIGFPEFVEWLLLSTSENVEDRLRWGFQICDVRSTGRITRPEVTALIRLMFGVLTGLELDHNNPYVGDLVSSLFDAGAAPPAPGESSRQRAGSESPPRPRIACSRALSAMHQPQAHDSHRLSVHVTSRLPSASSRVRPVAGLAARSSSANVASTPLRSGSEKGAGGAGAVGAVGAGESGSGGNGEEDEEPECLSWAEYRRGCLESADVMTAVQPLRAPYRKGYYGDKPLHQQTAQVCADRQMTDRQT